MLEEHQKRWGRGVWWAGVVGSLSFEVQGWGEVSPNLDPFGQIEKGRRGWGGCKNWTFFMDVINVWSLTNFFYLSAEM